MRRLLLIASLVLAVFVTRPCPAGAGEGELPSQAANLRVLDIDVQLFPVLAVGMEVPVVTVTVQNFGYERAPAFTIDARISYYGTDATHSESLDAAGLRPGAVRTYSFELPPEIVGVRDPHGITAIANPFPGELSRTDNRRFEIIDF